MGTCRMAYWRILLFFYSVIQQLLRILLCIYLSWIPTTESIFHISCWFGVEAVIWWEVWKTLDLESWEHITFLGLYLFLSGLIETTSVTDGWHSESSNRKSKSNILKKLRIHLTEITFAYKISLHTICIFLLDQELSSPFTKSKEKPDG